MYPAGTRLTFLNFLPCFELLCNISYYMSHKVDSTTTTGWTLVLWGTNACKCGQFDCENEQWVGNKCGQFDCKNEQWVGNKCGQFDCKNEQWVGNKCFACILYRLYLHTNIYIYKLSN